ncbi:MAG TPA: GNAT family N-acetyltransferase [Candidatus Peribacteraceae bacterium]|nr:GNAT family N-acetyltransferase [Candidatus Peribacteraceae bacterium]
MHQGDGCAHLIEQACFPSRENRLGQNGILEFLRQSGNFGLTMIEYEREAVRCDAYCISERRTNGFEFPSTQEDKERDWHQALQRQLEKRAFVLVSRSPSALMIEKICVHPDFQRKRHGTLLLLAIAKRLPLYGLNRIMAMVGVQHQNARAFFDSRWFSNTRHKLSGTYVFERNFDEGSLFERGAA